MKPEKIILIRHGESESNANGELHSSRPDYAMRLTTLGHGQADEAGKKLVREITPFESSKLHTKWLEPVYFYVSPFWRTRQTYEEIAQYFPNHKYYEDPRLREQEFGHFRGGQANQELKDARDNYGHFYYRIDDGESGADVFDRVSDFLNTMHRDFEKSDFPKNVILVNHGLTMRLFLMRWFHLSVEEYELLAKPDNCEYFVMQLQKDGKYLLTKEPRCYKQHHHTYQFNWRNPEPKTIISLEG